MEKPIVSVHGSYLVHVIGNKTSIELKTFGYQTQFAFDSQSSLASKSKNQWYVEAAKDCVDDSSGLIKLFLLASRNRSSSADKHFCILQTKWCGSNFFSHRSVAKRGASDSDKLSFDLLPFSEFTSDGLSSDFSCFLTRGPRVLLVTNNKVSLYGRNENHEKRITQSAERLFNDTVDNSHSYSETQGNAQQSYDVDSKILCVASEQEWIVSLIRNSFNIPNKHSLIAVVLEQSVNSGTFQRQTLRVQRFLPQEYASKISTMTIDVHRRKVVPDGHYSYESSCCVGLKDGFVMTFANGEMLTCVALWNHSTSAEGRSLAFGVETVIPFDDVLVCHTSRNDCFVVQKITNKVIHHWGNVFKVLMGDFLQSGGKQLLVLFDEGWPQDSVVSVSYLLTDFKGFVEDRRTAFDGESPTSEVDVRQEGDSDDDSQGNIQRVISALQEQSQGLVRRVAEEEQRLENKQLFVANTVKRLKALGLNGPQNQPDLQPSEVPLVPLLGRDKPIACYPSATTVGSDTENLGEVKVLSIWHRVLEDVFVVGAKIINHTKRELSGCVAVLTSSSAASSASPPSHCSTRTRVWQCFRADSPGSLDQKTPPSDAQPENKRRKVEPHFVVRQTQTVKPLESVTVTCSFDIPEFGMWTKEEFCLHLEFSLKGCKGSRGLVPWRQAKESDKRSSIAVKEGMEHGTENPATRYAANFATHFVDKEMKLVHCGNILVRASEELLQRNPASFWTEEEGLVAKSPGSKFEEDLLALSSIQHTWRCDVSFVLHETPVLLQCLQNAGLVYREQLNQYIATSSSPVCLHSVRVQVLRFHPLPERKTTLLLFVRDLNQLVLLLQHLRTHLTDDATITSVTQQSDHDLDHLAKLMSAELREKKRQAREIMVTSEKQNIEDKEKSSSGSDRTASVCGDEQRRTHSTLSDAREFSEQQKLYLMRHANCGQMDIAHYMAAVEEHEVETDAEIAKLKL